MFVCVWQEEEEKGEREEEGRDTRGLLVGEEDDDDEGWSMRGTKALTEQAEQHKAKAAAVVESWRIIRKAGGVERGGALGLVVGWVGGCRNLRLSMVAGV